MFNTYPAMMQTYLNEAVVNSFQIAQEFCFSCLQQLIIYLFNFIIILLFKFDI